MPFSVALQKALGAVPKGSTANSYEVATYGPTLDGALAYVVAHASDPDVAVLAELCREIASGVGANANGVGALTKAVGLAASP